MKCLGLIGKTLTHSFSKKYFEDKFEREDLNDWQYDLYELDSAEYVLSLFDGNPELVGLNVTLPYKEDVLAFLDDVSVEAREIGAVNVIKKIDGKLIGYNSDCYGFQRSLEELLNGETIEKAWILGTGGAAKAVQYVLKSMQIETQYISRTKGNRVLDYNQINSSSCFIPQLIVNTTPLGMYPHVNHAPYLPYERFSDRNYLFDLVYNPLETKFMKIGKEYGAHVANGLKMLHLQAEKAWMIWSM